MENLAKAAAALKFSLHGPYLINIEIEIAKLKISERNINGFIANYDELTINMFGPIVVLYRRCIVPDSCIINHGLPNEVYKSFREDHVTFDSILDLVSSSPLESVQVVRSEEGDSVSYAILYHSQLVHTLAISRNYFSEVPKITGYLKRDKEMLSLIRGASFVSEPFALLPLLHSAMERLAGTSKGKKIKDFLKKGACEEVLEGYEAINNLRNGIIHRQMYVGSADFISANDRMKFIIAQIFSNKYLI